MTLPATTQGNGREAWRKPDDSATTNRVTLHDENGEHMPSPRMHEATISDGIIVRGSVPGEGPPVVCCTD